MNRKQILVWSAIALAGCALPKTPPALPPSEPSAPAFIEFTENLIVKDGASPLKNCAVTLSFPTSGKVYRGSTSLSGNIAWQVQIVNPDPGGHRNAAVSIACPDYLLFEDSFVVAGENQDVTFGGLSAAGNHPILRAGPQIAVLKRRGLVRANGRVFVDDNGPFNPLGASFFWLAWGEKFDRDRMDQNLKRFDNRADYIRIFAEVGGGDINAADWRDVNWADRTIDPGWPDYVEQLGNAIDHAYDRHGLRVDLTIIGGGTGRVREAADGVRDVIRAGRQHKILALQVANEDNLPDTALRDDLTRRFMADFPWLQVSAYSTRDVDELKALLAAGIGNSITPHTDRDDRGDGNWRQVRQIYDVRNLPGTCRNDEPPGPQSSVATQEQPIHLAMSRAMSIIMGCGAYTFHAGAGIRGGGKADLVRGRPANFWEDPNFEAQMTALVAVGKIIPTDAANWTKEGSHWAGNPLLADTFLDEPGADHGVIAFYAAHADNRFIVLPQGVKQFVTITSKDAAVIEVFSPITGELLETVTAGAGGVFTLNGPERGGLSGYILRGRLKDAPR